MKDDSGAKERGTPSLRALFGWSAALLAISLLIAVLALPILHWLGFDPK